MHIPIDGKVNIAGVIQATLLELTPLGTVTAKERTRRSVISQCRHALRPAPRMRRRWEKAFERYSVSGPSSTRRAPDAGADGEARGAVSAGRSVGSARQRDPRWPGLTCESRRRAGHEIG